jgi:hypothetical protein
MKLCCSWPGCQTLSHRWACSKHMRKIPTHLRNRIIAFYDVKDGKYAQEMMDAILEVKMLDSYTKNYLENCRARETV